MDDNPLRIRLRVHYGQADLVDGDDFGEVPLGGPAGLLCPGPPGSGHVMLLTGLHTGDVDLTVSVTDTDPGPDLDAYEDAVEISLHMPNGTPHLVEWAGEHSHPLPPLPAGPGWYRLRYHARNADAGARADSLYDDRAPVDSYLLQIWPAPESGPRVLAVGSAHLRYWLGVTRS